MKKRHIRTVLLVVFAAVFLFSGAQVLKQWNEYREADKLNHAAQDLVMQPTESPQVTPTPTVTEKPEPQVSEEPEPQVSEEPEPTCETLAEDAQLLMDMNLAALKETNEDVLGWIHIPDSKISYPLLMVADNQEYLRRAWDGTPSQSGCIFLECKNYRDFRDFNSIIFGHHMNNGTMFGSLLNYKEQEYFDSHPYIYIVTEDTVRRYQVFSTYEAGVESDTYRLYFEDDARKQSVLDYYVESSVIESGIVPTVTDRILTLSTCTGTGTYHTRWVVQAVLNGEFARG